MSRLFESGLFSDCVIKCGDKVWRLHKAFLCSRSRFFRAAFTGVFEEAKTGDLTLREQDSDLVDLRCDTSTPLETVRFLFQWAPEAKPTSI